MSNKRTTKKHDFPFKQPDVCFEYITMSSICWQVKVEYIPLSPQSANQYCTTLSHDVDIISFCTKEKQHLIYVSKQQQLWNWARLEQEDTAKKCSTYRAHVTVVYISCMESTFCSTPRLQPSLYPKHTARCGLCTMPSCVILPRRTQSCPILGRFHGKCRSHGGRVASVAWKSGTRHAISPWRGGKGRTERRKI